MEQKHVLVVGATGLVGSQVVQALVEDPLVESVHCLVRSHQRHECQKVTYHWVDFMNLDAHEALFDGITNVICCIGTTMKKAKSREQFQLVDHYIPKEVARVAKLKGIGSFALVSSIGANASSRSFYLRVKGAIEDHLMAMTFDSLVVYRPSLLIGDRKEFRMGEVAMAIVFRLFSWVVPPRYAPTCSFQLAQQMVRNVHHPVGGVRIIEAPMVG